ncbi:hypothetical protein Tco_1049044, partial [Tanacetum coccineum]
MSVIDIVT